VYRVPCRDHEDGHGCGNWVTATRGACRIPLGVLADGVVVLAQPARADQPAIVRVTPAGQGGARIEYRFDPAPGPAGLELAASRACDRTGCDTAWTPAKRMEPER